MQSKSKETEETNVEVEVLPIFCYASGLPKMFSERRQKFELDGFESTYCLIYIPTLDFKMQSGGCKKVSE
jgi:hypothetical protein